MVHADKSLAVLSRFTGGRHEKIETCFRIEEGILVFGSMFLVSFCWVIDVYSRHELLLTRSSGFINFFCCMCNLERLSRQNR